MAFCVVFGAGWVARTYMPAPQEPTFYGLHVIRVLPPDSLDFVSRSTGPWRGDFCPKFHLMQYKPKVGYVLCKLHYVDDGCLDVRPGDPMIWVKNPDGSTATLSEADTFRPWNDPFAPCVKDEPTAQGGQ